MANENQRCQLAQERVYGYERLYQAEVIETMTLLVNKDLKMGRLMTNDIIIEVEKVEASVNSNLFKAKTLI